MLCTQGSWKREAGFVETEARVCEETKRMEETKEPCGRDAAGKSDWSPLRIAKVAHRSLLPRNEGKRPALRGFAKDLYPFL